MREYVLGHLNSNTGSPFIGGQLRLARPVTRAYQSSPQAVFARHSTLPTPSYFAGLAAIVPGTRAPVRRGWHHLEAANLRPLAHQHRAAIDVAAALETGLTSTGHASGDSYALTFTLIGDKQLKAACDAWRAYALASIDVPAPVAATAAHRATVQIGLALFDDPTLDLLQIAHLVATARAGSSTALLLEHPIEATEAPHGRS